MTYKVIRRSDIERCPVRAFDAAHYRDDGSCKCRMRYRWECSCGRQGPWRNQVALADALGREHKVGCRGLCRVADNRGRKCGAI